MYRVSPLFRAINNNHTDAVRLLLRCGADPNKSPPHRIRRESIVELLLEYGYIHHTPIINMVTEFGYIRVLNMLIERGDDVNYLDFNGCSPLSNAVRNNDTTMVRLLLKHGGNKHINHIPKYGQSNMVISAQNRNIEIVQLLLDNGADPDSTKCSFATALYISAEHGDIDIINLLINRGANIDRKTIRGNTALHAACKNGHEDIVRILMAIE
jgi:ankyrin repeat protein